MMMCDVFQSLCACIVSSFVCVCAHTHVHASACVRVGRVCGCASTLEKEGRRERRAGTTHDTVGVR